MRIDDVDLILFYDASQVGLPMESDWSVRNPAKCIERSNLDRRTWQLSDSAPAPFLDSVRYRGGNNHPPVQSHELAGDTLHVALDTANVGRKIWCHEQDSRHNDYRSLMAIGRVRATAAAQAVTMSAMARSVLSRTNFASVICR
jgi:hypothetical protein